MIFRIAAAAVFIAVAGVANAADLEAGMEAYERGDYTGALEIFRPLAEKGHADAQYSLGYMHFFGRGAPMDNAEAAAWYRRAAEQGQAEAQPMLGYMYYFGDSVPQDYAEAATWFRGVAEQGHAGAQFKLGYMHYKGLGVPQDYVSAYFWFNLASGQGDEEARALLNILEEEMTRDQVAEAQKLRP